MQNIVLLCFERRCDDSLPVWYSLHPFTWLSRRPKTCNVRLLKATFSAGMSKYVKVVMYLPFSLCYFFSLAVFVLSVTIWRNYGK